MANHKIKEQSKQENVKKRFKTGRIGKPQKSRKHKIKQTPGNSFVDNKSKNVKNYEPKVEDDQWVPRRAKEMMWAQQNMKSGIKKKNKKKRALVDDTDMGVTVPMEKAPIYVQGKLESNRKFMERVSMDTKMNIVQSKANAKMRNDVLDTEKTDKKEAQPKTKQFGEKKREKKKEKRHQKAEILKQKKLEKKGDFAEFQDPVMFGERVDEPPSLTVKPRKAAPKEGKDRPGRKSLLLTQMMEGGENKSSKVIKQKHKTLAVREVGHTVKRKKLSFAQQRITDAERETAIKLYRKLKANKVKSTDE